MQKLIIENANQILLCNLNYLIANLFQSNIRYETKIFQGGHFNNICLGRAILLGRIRVKTLTLLSESQFFYRISPVCPIMSHLIGSLKNNRRDMSCLYDDFNSNPPSLLICVIYTVTEVSTAKILH